MTTKTILTSRLLLFKKQPYWIRNELNSSDKLIKESYTFRTTRYYSSLVLTLPSRVLVISKNSIDFCCSKFI